jgi:hypothetical protein
MSEHSEPTEPVATNSIPYGVDEDDWKATKGLREQYHKLLVIQDAHSQTKHPWNSYCLCPEMAQTQETMAYIMSVIRRTILHVTYTDSLIARQKAAELLANYDAAMISPQEIFNILTESNDLLATDSEAK